VTARSQTRRTVHEDELALARSPVAFISAPMVTEVAWAWAATVQALESTNRYRFSLACRDARGCPCVNDPGLSEMKLVQRYKWEKKLMMRIESD
jgi:hypothetical protein